MVSLGRDRLAKNYNILKANVDPSLFKGLRGFIRMYGPRLVTAVFEDGEHNFYYFPLIPSSWDGRLNSEAKGYLYYTDEQAQAVLRNLFYEYELRR